MKLHGVPADLPEDSQGECLRHLYSGPCKGAANGKSDHFCYI